MIALTLLVSLSGPAWGQEEVCTWPVPQEALRQRLTEIESALVDLNGARATAMLDDLTYQTRCLDHAVDPADLGRVARQVSLLAFYEQDHDELAYWARLADGTVGDAPWSTELPIPGRLIEVLDELEPATTSRVEGRYFAPPKRGIILVDGRFAAVPEATIETQHLFQVLDKKQRVIHTSWMDGTLFPDAWLTDEATELEPPSWYVEPAPPHTAAEDIEPVPVPVPLPVAEPVPTIETPPDPLAEPELAPIAAADEVEDEPQLSFDEEAVVADCPWKQVRRASATGREVSVNKLAFDVGSASDQDAFRKVLRTCGEYRAARRFSRWRDAKKKLQFDARTHRDRMVRALITDEPTRKKDRVRRGG